MRFFTVILGIVLLISGAIYFAFGGFSFTQTQQVADIGPVQINSEKTRTVPYNPLVAGALAGGGAILLLTGMQSSNKNVA